MYLLLNFFVSIEQKLQYYDEQMQHGQVLKMEIISFSNLKIFKFNKKISSEHCYIWIYNANFFSLRTWQDAINVGTLSKIRCLQKNKNFHVVYICPLNV